MVNHLERQRDAPESYIDYRKFLLNVIPFENSEAHSDLYRNLSLIQRYGLWSLAFGKRMEAIYEAVRGHSVFEDEKYCHAIDERADRKKIAQTVRIVQQFVGVISENVNTPNFDIDQFQEIFIRVYTELGPTVTKWFTKFYSEIINSNIDPQDYFEAVRQTTLLHGKSTGALFSGGYRRVVELGVEPTHFAEAIDRVSSQAGKVAAKTFTLQSGKVLEKGQELSTFEQEVIETSNAVGADINYWIIQASLEMEPDGEYTRESLITDVSTLEKKYGHKTALWFAKGVTSILKAQKYVDNQIKYLKKQLEEKDFKYFTSEELTKYITRDTYLRTQLDPFAFRQNFSQLIDGIGPYVAHCYALARLNGVHVTGFANFNEALELYVQAVGEKFAKKTLFMISRICENSPGWIQGTLETVVQIKEAEGEEALMNYLRYSFAASKGRRGGQGLIKPKDPNAEDDEEKTPDDEQTDFDEYFITDNDDLW